jgi:hypothetical protein
METESALQGRRLGNDHRFGGGRILLQHHHHLGALLPRNVVCQGPAMGDVRQWNTEQCYDRTLNDNETIADAIRRINNTWNNATPPNGTAEIVRRTPAEEFWQ